MIRTLTILLAMMLAGSAAAQDITTGLAGHWPMQVGAANTDVPTGATLVGGENTADVLVAGPGGSLPFAHELDGNDSITTLATSVGGVDLFADSDNWTVAFWTKTPSASGGTFVAKAGGSAGSRTLQIFLSAAPNKPGVIIRGTSTAFDSGIDDNAWHHWALTWNGTTATLYKDGVSQGTASAGTATIEAENIKFGARTNTPAVFLTGSLSDVRIYSRALTVDDVAALVALSSSAKDPLSRSGAIGGNATTPDPIPAGF